MRRGLQCAEQISRSSPQNFRRNRVFSPRLERLDLLKIGSAGVEPAWGEL